MSSHSTSINTQIKRANSVFDKEPCRMLNIIQRFGKHSIYQLRG